MDARTITPPCVDLTSARVLFVCSSYSFVVYFLNDEVPELICSYMVAGLFGARCAACRRIEEWNKRRRELLREIEDSGKKPWVGAGAVRPDSYAIPLDADTIGEVPYPYRVNSLFLNMNARCFWS